MLMKETAPQREHSLQDVFNALRSFGWLARFRRLARDYERLKVLRGLHFLVFAMLLLPKAVPLLGAVGSS